jgi:Cu/Ag efflux pump CusA
MMTVVTIMTGLMPIPWTHGPDFEVNSCIVVPMIGA